MESSKLVFLLLIWTVNSFPTVYKYNENKLLEPDLIPVSSTVIPLPVYQVSYGLHAVPSLKDDKVKKPEGPISLVTVHNNRKKISDNQSKVKSSGRDISIVKEIKN